MKQSPQTPSNNAINKSSDATPNRRRFTRLPFNARARLYHPGSDQGQEVILLDLSLQGALIALTPNQEIPKVGENKKLELSLDEIDTLIIMETQVAYIQDNHIGLRCLMVDLDSITHLRRLVELNLGNAELLQREIAFLAQAPFPAGNN